MTNLLFKKQWICIGHIKYLKKPGDYFTKLISDIPIIVIRDKLLQIRVFLNVCRHRSARLLEGKGNTSGIVCPFHSWAYNLEGKLKGAPNMDEAKNFHKEEFGLKEFQSEERLGLCFVSFDKSNQKLDDQIDNFEVIHSKWPMENLISTRQRTFTVNCNWKAFLEVFNEYYHLQFVESDSKTLDNDPLHIENICENCHANTDAMIWPGLIISTILFSLYVFDMAYDTDDHDIGQGNLWGENGKIASSPAGNDGGYFYDKDYVKMVERAQTNHLPDPYDSTPIDQGIGVYYTNLQFGGIDFAIIEDRKFKSGPNGKIPQQGPRPDHIRNPEYDPSSIDLDNLVLLGERQLKFLQEWGENKNFMMKAVLSQTGFCGGAHLHGKKENRLHADLDSNGWPQKGRNKALQLIKKANAVHIAGDQHLPTVIHHGINEYEDGPWAFVVPAIINNYYSRWWWPENEIIGENGNNLLPWTGRYKDGFDNKITMHAYANPDSNSNGAGYGIIKFNKTKNNVTFECWPRFVDVSLENSKQFEGWPVTVSLD